MRRALVVGTYIAFAALVVAFAVWGQPLGGRTGRTSEIRFEVGRALEDLKQIDAITRAAGGRSVGSPGNAQVREYVAQRFRDLGLVVAEDAFRDTLGGAMTNLLATLPGERDETILICAHHDVDGAGPGAVDGSTGLALLLELARDATVARRVTKGTFQSRTILFASWDGTAVGCAGSTHFIDSLSAKDRSRLRAVVSLDAVGWKDGAPVLHTLPYQDRMGIESIAPDWLVTSVANAGPPWTLRLPVGDRWMGLAYQVLVRSVDVGYYSDDKPFLAKGVPAVFVGDFSLMRDYARSGTPRDTIDQVGSAQLAAAGLTVEAGLAQLSSADALPPGESDYLVFPKVPTGVFRLTREQLCVLAVLALIPAVLVLVARRSRDRLAIPRVLFLAFAILFTCAILADPVLFSVLFMPAILAAPLLAIPRAGAAVAHLAALAPALVFTAILVPVYVSGDGGLVRMGTVETVTLVTLLVLGLAQLPLHWFRAKHPALPVG